MGAACLGIWQRVYVYYRDTTIEDLRQMLKDYCSPETLKNIRRRYENTINRWKRKFKVAQDEVNLIEDSLKKNVLRIKALEEEKVVLSDKSERLERENESYNVRAVREERTAHKKTVDTYQAEVASLKKHLTEKDDKLLHVQKRISKQQSDYEATHESMREHEAKLHNQDARIQELEKMNREMKRDHETESFQLRQEAALFASVKSNMFNLAGSEDPTSRMDGTAFVASLGQDGVNLSKLGVDPHQLQTSLAWARDMVGRGSSALNPTTGIHVQRSHIPSGDLYNSGITTLRPTTPTEVMAAVESDSSSPSSVFATPPPPYHRISLLFSPNAFDSLDNAMDTTDDPPISIAAAVKPDTTFDLSSLSAALPSILEPSASSEMSFQRSLSPSGSSVEAPSYARVPSPSPQVFARKGRSGARAVRKEARRYAEKFNTLVRTRQWQPRPV
ncbi:hypothetical protein E8E13_006257 [Curvularia kusanoi]|uniref:Uncharacterized protein n=1 Tax=Curvularia kusanoi TaxID=90978 RepID=A0A9P4T8Z4_CURKU|nr:hypothetical protein E8E13_006257 [Curvularia kusanoi]